MGKKDAAENVKVLVRCRPLSEKEKANGHTNCVEMDLQAHTVAVQSAMGNPDRWTFDAVINNTFSQKDIFTQYIMPLVDSVLDGFNATVFAYGQSGSGKTHTMTGVMGDAEMEGVIPRCFQYIFAHVKQERETNPQKAFSMYVSFVELYNGKVRDLLAKQQVTLEVREHKDKTFFVQGVHVPQVKFPEEIIRLMEEGTERRRTACTELNADSSRSHSLFTLVLECTETLEDGTARSVTSKLNLVDLAGSERQGKTGASGETLKEGCNINLSLSALGTVIDCIVKGAPHVPFRSSPLTMLLKDSLGGNSKTVMFANINPSERNLSETVSTLRFADRAKQIKNKPVVNMDSKDQKIAELAELVAELKEKLEKYATEGTDGLEREVETLRERVGELEVSLDNAVKGREADLVDFESVKAKLTQERQTFNGKIVEMEEQIAQLQNDLLIAETGAKDAKKQQKDVLELCSKYANEGKPIASADQLAALLRDKSFGTNSAEFAALQTKVDTLTVENKSLKKDYKALKKDMEQQIKNAKEETEAAENKIKHLKKDLQAARDAWELEEAAGMTPTTNGSKDTTLNAATMNNSSTNEAPFVQEDSGMASTVGGASVVGGADDGPHTSSRKRRNPQQELQHLNETYRRRQTELLEAVKLDDNGTKVLELLQKENDELRHQLVVKRGVVVSTGDGGAETELKNTKSRLSTVEKERDRLYDEIAALREEVTAANKSVAEATGKINEVRSEYERKLQTSSAGDRAEEVGEMEAKLKERVDQLEQLRLLLDKQKALIVKSNEKNEYYQQQLKEAHEKTAALEAKYKGIIEEKDAHFQKAVSERLESYAEERKKEDVDHSSQIKKLKKKMKKLEESLAEMEQEYDKKVCECEELRSTLSEQKLGQLKLARRMEYGEDEAEVIEKKEQIQGALERAREERRRKSDKFAMGEVTNAKYQ